MDNGNLLVFSFPIYALLDPRSTLFMVTPFVANHFELLTEIVHEPFLVSASIGDNVKAEGVCREIKLGIIRFKSSGQQDVI